MLVIRKKQLEAILQHTYIAEDRGFFSRMLTHLKGVFPEKTEAMGDAETRILIQSGLGRAFEYGICKEWNVALFIDLLVGVSEDFDDRKETTWIRAVLEDKRLPEDARLDLIYREIPKRIE